MKYYPHIDGLRALAVVPVILFHFGVPPFSGGYAGVDVFFVISGFLITGIIAEGLRGGTFSLARFYKRRARRILPALFVMCLFSTVAALALFLPADYKSFSRSLEGVAGFASNFIFARNTGYFAESHAAQPLLHTWSLAVEEQFYILFPLFLMLLYRRHPRDRQGAFINMVRTPAFAGVAFWGLLLFSFLLNVYFIESRPEKTFYLLHTRAWELLAGAALSLWPRRVPLSRRAAEAMGAAGLGLLAACYVLYTRETVFPGLAALGPVIGAALVIWSGLGHPTLAARLLSGRAVVFTGAISYGLYLYHWPLLVFTRYAGFQAGPLALTALTFACAAASYVLIEKPVRSGRVFPLRRTVFALSAAGLLLFGGIGLSGVASGGFPGRFDARVLQYARGAEDREWRGAPCVPAAEDAGACRIGEGRPEFVLWGDSHAQALAPAVEALALARGKAGIAFARSGCPPLAGAERADGYVDFSCAEAAERALGLIARSGAKNVLLVARWDMYAEGWEEGSVETAREPLLKAGALARAEAVRAGLGASLGRLGEMGVTAWVVKQPPPHLEHVPTALARAALRGGDIARAGRPYEEVAARLAGVDRIIGAARGLRVIDLSETFCPAKTPCRVEAGGRALYSDNNHLSVTGALWAKGALEPFFSAL